MTTDLRTCTAIALLAMCGHASTEAADAVSTHQDDTSAGQLAEPDGGEKLQESAMADTSGARSVTDFATLAGNAATASAEDVTPAAGKRLTLRQKRIFVLGLAAQEKK